MKRHIVLLVTMLLALAGCGDFYATMGGDYTGTTGTTGSTGTLPGNGLFVDGWPTVNVSIPTSPTGIYYNFSRSMNTSTLIPGNIQLLFGDNTPTGISFSVTVTSDKSIQIALPALSPGTGYKFVFTPAIQYADNTSIGMMVEIPFYTSSGGTGFSLDWRYPADGEVNIPTSPVLQFRFTAPLNTTTVNGSTVQLVNTYTWAAVSPLSITYPDSQSFQIAGLTLTPGQPYRVILTTNIRNTSGNPLPTETHVNFTTAGGDTTPPAEVTPTFSVSENGAVTLKWQDPPDSDLKEIEIYNHYNSTTYTVPKYMYGYRIEGLVNGVFYNFTVRTRDLAGNTSPGITMEGMPRPAASHITAPGISSFGSGSTPLAYMPPVSSFPRGLTDTGSGQIVNPFSIGLYEVDYALWYQVRTWAIAHGYSFTTDGHEGSGNQGSPGASPGANATTTPATGMDWRSAIVWCNALTEYHNSVNPTMPLYPVYTQAGTPVKSAAAIASLADISYNPMDSGYRLPDDFEWEAAARFVNSYDMGHAWDIAQGGLYWAPGSHISGNGEPYNYSSTMTYAYYGGYETGFSGTKAANQMGMYDMCGNASELAFKGGETTLQPAMGGNAGATDATTLRIGSPGTFWSINNPVRYVGFRLTRTEFYRRY